MAQTRDDAKVGGWFAEGYSCVSMDHAPNAKFLSRLALCPHADTCPGCPLLDLSYPDQLARKLQRVKDALAAYPEQAALTVAPTEPAAATFRYRTRAKLVASQGLLGLYARGTHQVLDIPHCRVIDPQVAVAVATLRTLLPSQPLLAGVDVARAGGRLLVTLIAHEEADDAGLRALAQELVERCPDIAGIATTRRAGDAVQLLAGGHVLVSGKSQLRVSPADGGPYHYLAFGAFMQANEQVAQRIYEALSQRVFAAGRVRPRVLELYAGSGALSLALAARGAEMVAIESYGPACERLARAAAEQALPVSVLHGDAGEELRGLARDGAAFDVVLVNPPRRGLAPDVRTQVAALAPQAVGYVSCHPGTLARDLAHFAQLGLLTESATPFDMMPMTEQVETLAWLAPGAVPALVVGAESAEGMAVEKPPFTTMDGLLQRVRRLPGYEAAVPALALSALASGLVWFTRGPVTREDAARPAVHTFSVLAKGVLRARGTLRGQGGALVRYQREQVIGGHSLLRLFAPDERSVRSALLAVSHPLLGDATSDRESARYFAMRHGLDRRFLHLVELSPLAAGEAPRVSSPLAPDLAAVLRSLADRAPHKGALADP